MNKASIIWILDTDHLSLFQNADPFVTQRIIHKNPENLAITVITVQEKLQGWLSVINRYNSQS
jgi:tRNA(fMet)-specific endonuclease VapC